MNVLTFRVLRQIERIGDKLWRDGDHDAARRVWMIHGALTAAAFGPGANLCGPFEALR
jgi:hypothetical protein